MDYVWSLEERTRFIGMFYREARAPFVETKRRIEAEVNRPGFRGGSLV